MHHIVADGWSTGVLVREVAALYAAYARGQVAPLPELPIQYTDFACWQKDHQQKKWQGQLDYWREKLAGAPALLELPTDRRRPPVLTYRGATASFRVRPDVAQRLAALGQEEGGSLFMTLLAAFQTLLHRYSGQDDICVGTPIANRNRRQTEGLIGFFVNTLVLRARMAGSAAPAKDETREADLTFRSLLRQVRDTALEAYDHQDLPFEMLVEGLQPERSASHAPFFQVMFALQNAPVGALELPGLAIAPLDVHSGVAKFDLTLVMYEQEGEPGGGLGGTVEYNVDLWDAATIERMLSHFMTLLEGIAADADRPLYALPLLAEAEREQLLVAWNDTDAAYPAREGERELCMHEWVAQQARRTPRRRPSPFPRAA